MRKTDLARRAFKIYKGGKTYLLLPYLLVLACAFSLPAVCLTYLYEEVYRGFFILIPVYVYFAFPIWLGCVVSFFLMMNAFAIFFGMRTFFVRDEATFEDMIYAMFGFRLKADASGK